MVLPAIEVNLVSVGVVGSTNGVSSIPRLVSPIYSKKEHPPLSHALKSLTSLIPPYTPFSHSFCISHTFPSHLTSPPLFSYSPFPLLSLDVEIHGGGSPGWWFFFPLIVIMVMNEIGMLFVIFHSCLSQ